MNTQVLQNYTIPGTPTPRRLLGAYLEETRCEALRLLRNPGLVFPVLVMPIALYSLFAFVLTADAMSKDATLGVFLFIAFAVMATSMPALFGIGTSLAMERDIGMFRLKRAQPAPVGSWLVAKIACGVGFGIIGYLPLLGVALASGKLQLDTPAVINMSIALIAGTIPFCAMGLMIGTLVKGTAAPGYANLVYLPGCYLSGMFFPLPASMYWQSSIWPQLHVSQIAIHAAGATKLVHEPLLTAVISSVAFTAMFSFVAIWRLARKG